MSEPVPALTPQQQRFIEEYAKDKNQVRAALAAGLSDSYFAAAQAARALLKNPQIRNAVKHVFRVQAKRLKMEIPDVIREWAILGKSDLDDYELTDKGRITTRPGVPRSALRAVKKVKITRTEKLTGRGDSQELTVEYRAEIELHAKEGPLAKLHEHLHGVLPGETKGSGVSVELATRILASIGTRGADVGGSGGGAVPDAVGAEPGTTEPCVPE
ncbi:Terminase small subunit [Gemmata sp. SH-PL17]|uniref:terminase small subunit n=1 Tax=Gemmata sp. SH-PL17 TaxID=1630693 RepID=UPI00078ED3AD|nr:terminase small subunit [Gemmata sp. SH-PL17]AMV25495.1 Terminase small subunit [Gemmata sp. SH-PL17]